jgi:hypothetical protein
MSRTTHKESKLVNGREQRKKGVGIKSEVEKQENKNEIVFEGQEEG